MAESLLERTRRELIREMDVREEAGEGIGRGEPVRVRMLDRSEAIGLPERAEEFVLWRGRERLMEATVREAKGQAFCGRPLDWEGTVGELLALPLSAEADRAVFLAGANALGRALGLLGEETRHCRDEGPKDCAREAADRLRRRMGDRGRLLLVGYQPALASAVLSVLGGERTAILDLDAKNVGRVVEGARIRDGERELGEALEWLGKGPSPLEAEGKEAAPRLMLATGSTFVNGTADGLRDGARAAGAEFALFGTTAALPARLLGFERWCFASF